MRIVGREGEACWMIWKIEENRSGFGSDIKALLNSSKEE